MSMMLTRRPASTATAPRTAVTRLRVRTLAMYLSLAIAALYGLIASNVVTVIAGPAEQVARDQLGFALPAAAVYALGTVLLWRFDHRVLWAAGAILQVLVIAMYFAVSPQRDPTFEAWGITIRMLQFALLAALAHLATRSGEAHVVDRETRG